jgi:hypothetical protein
MSKGVNTYRSPFLSAFLRVYYVLFFTFLFIVAFSDFSFAEVRHMNPQIVDITADAQATSLALDGNDNPHISYRGSDSLLRYASWEAGYGWRIQSIPGQGIFSSIAVDSQGRPHISYYSNNKLMYASWESGSSTWEIQTVDSGGTTGYYSSIVLDSQDRPHIAYIDLTNTDLKYASWEGSSWRIQTVNVNSVSEYCDIDLESDNDPRIAYRGGTTRTLKHAYWDGSWKYWSYVDSGDISWVSIAVDTNNYSHMVYVLGGSLKHVYYQTVPHMPAPTVIDSGAQYLYDTSIALDSGNREHISYRYQGVDDYIKYASWEGSSWVLQKVSDDRGGHTSIAVDGNEHPHISYRLDNSGNLMYTFWDEIPPIVTVEALNAPGLTLEAGIPFEVKWKATDDIGFPLSPFAGEENYITIYCSTDEGKNWFFVTTPESQLEENDPGTTEGKYTWIVPDIASTECLLSIEARDGGGNVNSDMSDYKFSIVVLPGFSVLSIKSVTINGTRFLNGGIIPPERVNSIAIELTSEAAVSTCEMYVDGVPIILTGPGPTPPPWIWTGIFNSPPSPPQMHYLTIYASNEAGREMISTLEAQVISGRIQLIGTPFNYPNPFKPLSAETTMIQYSLSNDASIIIILYDITGREIKRWRFPSGSNGGRTGLNEIVWDGRSIFGEVAGNGMYVYKIISGGNVIGTGKLVIRD